MARPRRSRRPQPITLDDVHAYLDQMPREQLLDLLRAELTRSDSLVERLRLQVARTSTGGDRRVATFCSALEHAIAVDDYISYGAAFDYFRGIEEMIDEIERVLADDPAGVAELAEYAIGAVHEAGSATPH